MKDNGEVWFCEDSNYRFLSQSKVFIFQILYRALDAEFVSFCCWGLGVKNRVAFVAGDFWALLS